jgi:hypothetical protein
MREGNAGNKAELRRKFNRHRIEEQQARIEVARGRSPHATMPAAAAGLLSRNHPAPIRTADPRQCHSSVIGRADRLKGENLEAGAARGFGKLEGFA